MATVTRKKKAPPGYGYVRVGGEWHVRRRPVTADDSSDGDAKVERTPSETPLEKIERGLNEWVPPVLAPPDCLPRARR